MPPLGGGQNVTLLCLERWTTTTDHGVTVVDIEKKCGKMMKIVDSFNVKLYMFYKLQTVNSCEPCSSHITYGKYL